ncbi:thioesterase [Actinokineospora bangkokensis]|uniref:Thioesterase n=2 Tax=Actinokineospora bangkokensis TaxID=1193682 RepID=A0A1Q9LC80_9PSEU|nr:thioesterase [Actinokineospora bangkokensis]
MDAYGHVNHARTVTLMEEARVQMLFRGAAAQAAGELSKGLIVVKLDVHYRAPLFTDVESLRTEIAVTRLQVSNFVLRYAIHTGPAEADPVGVTATTTMAAFDFERQAPRRITEPERAFLATWLELPSA